MTGYDIIGDIHGCADELEALLQKLGYEVSNGSYRNPDRKVVFLGDFIDRGPKQKETLDIVRPMIDGDSAHAIMGNHEFNAICYATLNENGNYIREHSDKNTGQHQKFLEAYPHASDDYKDVISWFKTLPVFIEFDGFSVVHACWHSDSIQNISSHLKDNNKLSDEAYQEYGDKGTSTYEALEILLKGPEYPLPEELYFKDKDGNPRKKARVRWWAQNGSSAADWLEFGGATLSQAQEVALKDMPEFDGAIKVEHPVFFGHYWLKEEPKPLSSRATCLDYSVAKGGKLVAYRWDGEEIIKSGKFVWCD